MSGMSYMATLELLAVYVSMAKLCFVNRKFVIRREVVPKKEGAKPYTKAPKIQRLVTPQRMQHKRHRLALKRRRAEASKDAANEYAQLLAKRVHEEREKRTELRKRRASSMRK